MNEAKVKEICNKYSENNMARLKRISYPLIAKYGGVSNADYDDFYSIANETLWKAARDYDEEYSIDNLIKFENFLYGCLSKKFKTYITERNRQKRIPSQLITSIDAPVADGSERTYAEVLESDFDVTEEIEELSGNTNFDKFLSGLSKKQIAIVDLIIQGYDFDAIKKILNITEKRFRTCMNGMKTFNNRILLSNCTY